MLGLALPPGVVQQATASSENDWQTWAPVGSAAVALVALLVALSNRRTARRALTLSESQEERRVARLDVSLKDELSGGRGAKQRGGSVWKCSQ